MSDRHMHIWTGPDPDGTWACVTCPDTSPTCVVERPSDEPGEGHPTAVPAQSICDGCLRYEHRVLDDTADALGHWQHQPRSLVPAIRYDRDKLKGTGTGEQRRSVINHPRDVVEVLWTWADTWSEARTEPAPQGDVIGFLKRHLIWAANTPGQAAWGDYRTEARELRHHARRLAHLLPQRQAGPCVHCGGQIVRDWADEHWQPRIDIRPEHNGLSDIHRCTGCGLTWDHRESWMYTNRHTLRLAPEFAPDTLVTLEDARKHIWPHVPASTWRTWAERDTERAGSGDEQLMPERGRDVRGRALYRVGDLDVMVRRRADTARPGRKAG